MSPSVLQEPCSQRCDRITGSGASAPSQLYPVAEPRRSARGAGFCVAVATRRRSDTFTYRQLRPVCQAVLEGDAQGEVDFQVAEIAVLLDVKGVSALLDGDLQVVVRSQLPLDQVNSYAARKKIVSGAEEACEECHCACAASSLGWVLSGQVRLKHKS